MERTKIAEIEKGNTVFCCDGCTHTNGWNAADGWQCAAYGKGARQTYSRRVFGICPMNRKEKAKKVFKRVGQQKTKRMGGK